MEVYVKFLHSDVISKIRLLRTCFFSTNIMRGVKEMEKELKIDLRDKETNCIIWIDLDTECNTL